MTEQSGSDEWSSSALYRDPTAPTDQRQALETEAERGFHRDVLTSDPTAPVDSPTTPADHPSGPARPLPPAVPVPPLVPPPVAAPSGPPAVWEGQSNQRGQNQQGPGRPQGQAGQRGQNRPGLHQPTPDASSHNPDAYDGPMMGNRAMRRAGTGPTARPRGSRAWLWVAIPVAVILFLLLTNSLPLRP